MNAAAPNRRESAARNVIGGRSARESAAPIRPIPVPIAAVATISGLARTVLYREPRTAVTSALDELLARSLPHGTASAGPHRVSLRVAGRQYAATLTGLGARLLQLAHAAPAGERLDPGARAVLTVDIEGAALRMDLPVEIVTWGRAHVVLRAIGAPLVLRRRIVRDQALADALGVASARPAVVAAA